VKIIGMDLGTTNSCVYYLDEAGDPVLVMDPNRVYKTFSSVVWQKESGGEIIVGKKAKSRLGRQPPPVTAVKRKMGTNETVMLGSQKVTPVEVSAHIIRHAVWLVEQATGDKVGGAVITVPAYFDSAPKKDTEEAAVLALFDNNREIAKGRLELMLEPEAAAYAYATEGDAEKMRILVYDLGGGTFDITILERTREAGLRMTAVGGDPHLGGDNVDDRIANWFLYLLRGGNPQAIEKILGPERYPEEKRYTVLQMLLTDDRAGLRSELRPEDKDLLILDPPPRDLDLDSNDPEDLQRIQTLKNLAEKTKTDLTQTTDANAVQHNAFEDHQGELVDIDIDISRHEFNLLIGDLIEKTLEETRRVMGKAKKTPTDFDNVLLVGGSTRMPIVKTKLEEIFQCPVKLADPDLIVARGAALRARELNVSGDEKMRLDFPRETFEEEIEIRGQLNQKLVAHQAYLLRDGNDVADAPVKGDRFAFPAVPLTPEKLNIFQVEVLGEDENLGEDEKLFASTEIGIRHSADWPEPQDLRPKITKPIRSRGKRGFKELFPEGEQLPATKPFTCYRAAKTDYIEIEFYEGERYLTSLVIRGIDSGLRIGAEIDCLISINADYSVAAEATVRESRQKQTVEFDIPRLVIPPIEKMDEDVDEVLEQIENDLGLIRDRNARGRFARRCRKLENEYRKAGRDLETDKHHLFTIIGELRKLLVDIRAAQVVLEPSIEEFDGRVSVCRGLAGKLPATAEVREEQVLERLTTLSRKGQEAWDAENQSEWKLVNNELAELHKQLEYATRPKSPDIYQIPPLVIQHKLLKWIGEIAQLVKENELQGRFGSEVESVRKAIREVALGDADEARRKLVEIAQQQLGPLDQKVKGAIVDSGGTVDERGPVIDF